MIGFASLARAAGHFVPDNIGDTFHVSSGGQGFIDYVNTYVARFGGDYEMVEPFGGLPPKLFDTSQSYFARKGPLQRALGVLVHSPKTVQTNLQSLSRFQTQISCIDSYLETCIQLGFISENEKPSVQQILWMGIVSNIKEIGPAQNQNYFKQGWFKNIGEITMFVLLRMLNNPMTQDPIGFFASPCDIMEHVCTVDHDQGDSFGEGSFDAVSYDMELLIMHGVRDHGNANYYLDAFENYLDEIIKGKHKNVIWLIENTGGGFVTYFVNLKDWVQKYRQKYAEQITSQDFSNLENPDEFLFLRGFLKRAKREIPTDNFRLAQYLYNTLGKDREWLQSLSPQY